MDPEPYFGPVAAEGSESILAVLSKRKRRNSGAARGCFPHEAAHQCKETRRGQKAKRRSRWRARLLALTAGRSRAFPACTPCLHPLPALLQLRGCLVQDALPRGCSGMHQGGEEVVLVWLSGHQGVRGMPWVSSAPGVHRDAGSQGEAVALPCPPWMQRGACRLCAR